MSNSEKLKIGDKAPIFEAESTKGNISLNNYKGKYVILYFYPKDATPGCTVQANEFTELYNQFKAIEAEVIGISRDDISSHHNFSEKEGINFPLISDVNEDLCNSYKVLREKINFGRKYIGLVRSTFIIDKNQNIYKALYNVKAKGHASKILDELKTLK